MLYRMLSRSVDVEMRNQDGYMSRDAWSSKSTVHHHCNSNTEHQPIAPVTKKTGHCNTSSAYSYSSHSIVQRTAGPTMPTSLSGSTRSQSAADILSFNDQPVLREALEALSIDIASNGIPADHLQSHFLALPAELRTAIYTTTLFDDCNDLNILYTNRQVYMEASPILYHRPINFPSQARLMAWITRSSQTDLNRVRTLTLRLTDVDFSPLFESPPVNRSTARPTAWNLYQQELENLDKALQSLPNLLDLAIIPPERINSQLLKGMYFSFLGLIPERLPRLRRLTIHDEETLQDKIPKLRKLPDVVFDQPKSASSSPSSSAPKEYRSFSDVMKHAQSPTPKVKSEEEAGGMEGVWFG